MPRNQRGQRGGGVGRPLTRAAARAQGVQPPVAPVHGQGKARGGRVAGGRPGGRQRGGRGRPIGGVVAVAPQHVANQNQVAPAPRRRVRQRVRGGRPAPVRGRGRGRPVRIVQPHNDDNADIDNDDNDSQFDDDNDQYVDPANEFDNPDEFQDQINQLQHRLIVAQRGANGRQRGRGNRGGQRRAIANDQQDQEDDEENWEDVEDHPPQPGRGVKRRREVILTEPAEPAGVEGDPEPVLVDRNGARQALKDLLGVDVNINNSGDALSSLYIDGFTIDMKTKRKIWSGAYVDLSVFAPKLNLPSKMNCSEMNKTRMFGVTMTNYSVTQKLFVSNCLGKYATRSYYVKLDLSIHRLLSSTKG